MRSSRTLQLIQGRRTVRRFHPDEPIEADRLDRVLEAAIWAPLSVYHPQGCRFIALQRAERDRVVEIVIRDHTILKYVRYMYDRTPIGHDEKWARQAEYFGKTLGEAPVIVACLVAKDGHAARMEHNLGAAWCAAQNMMLQSEAEGLSSGVVSLGSDTVCRRLVEHLGHDPDAWTVPYLMNLGTAAESPAPFARQKERVIELRG